MRNRICAVVAVSVRRESDGGSVSTAGRTGYTSEPAGQLSVSGETSCRTSPVIAATVAIRLVASGDSSVFSNTVPPTEKSRPAVGIESAVAPLDTAAGSAKTSGYTGMAQVPAQPCQSICSKRWRAVSYSIAVNSNVRRGESRREIRCSAPVGDCSTSVFHSSVSVTPRDQSGSASQGNNVVIYSAPAIVSGSVPAP